MALSVMTAAPSAGAADAPIFADQGPLWTAATRKAFYSGDQGSQMIPFDWLRALHLPNGAAFLGDGLARYGYLPNPARGDGLPVGFTTVDLPDSVGSKMVGMTCAACHTRQITVAGQSWRIDGGPAIVDFQSLLSDLDTAVGAVLADDASFAAFANSVAGETLESPDAPEFVTNLHGEVAAWYERYHALMMGAPCSKPGAPTVTLGALPKQPWGTGRLDAVGMIFDRLTGLDLGPPPSHVIACNIKPADAPVRYPFLWNASIQNKTQWPGFAPNGDVYTALIRNVGEVYGVFGEFTPVRDPNPFSLYKMSYTQNNSANFHGLADLEDFIKRIGPPQWPSKATIDRTLAERGRKVFENPAPDVGCLTCHDKKINVGLLAITWNTPVMDVETDRREYAGMNWQAETGILNGQSLLNLTAQLKPVDAAFSILKLSALGFVLQKSFPIAPAAVQAKADPRLTKLLAADEPVKFGAYESRVLEGIWAAAPYLHNGSVPSLAELLKPSAERVASFKVGPAYDLATVGLAVDQPQSTYTMQTTDCGDKGSGNSRCGHEFGTHLSPDDKKALLEYLKTL